MTIWLKSPKPPKGPAMPPSVDAEVFWAEIEKRRGLGIQTPAQAFLSVKAPAIQLDDYGQPLPLSPMEQDYLDRMFAVCADPNGRGEALLHAGQLCPDEVEPIATAFPEIYEAMCERAQDDMINSGGPPFPAWAEATLTVLFQRPAAAVYNPKSEAPTGSPPKGKIKTPEGTQADRREIAVREKAA